MYTTLSRYILEEEFKQIYCDSRVNRGADVITEGVPENRKVPDKALPAGTQKLRRWGPSSLLAALLGDCVRPGRMTR